MPECHKCSRDGNPTRDCLKCKGPSDNLQRGGAYTVSMDATPAGSEGDQDGFTPMVYASAHSIPVPDSFSTALPPCCDEAVKTMLSVLTQLAYHERNYVFYLLSGGTPKAWAIKHNINSCRLSRKWHKITERHPMLAVLVPSSLSQALKGSRSHAAKDRGEHKDSNNDDNGKTS